MFDKIDLNDFWDSSSEYDYLKLEPFSEEKLRAIEKEIGYKLPESYIALLRVQNGGCPKNKRVGNTSWLLEGIYGICKGESEFWENEGVAYPKIGVPICISDYDCDRIFLDYRECGNDGEPRVVGISPEMDTIEFIAKDFESFINMLVPARYDENDELIEEDVVKIDPYEGVQFTPVEGEQKKELDRYIWKGMPGFSFFTIFCILIGIVLNLFDTDNKLLSLLSNLAYIAAALGFLITIGGIIYCSSQSKRSYECYVDTVDLVWEANEPISKTKYNQEKRTFFFHLTKSKAESYPNTEGFKEGDRIRVYRVINDKNGEVMLVKEQVQK